MAREELADNRTRSFNADQQGDFTTKQSRLSDQEILTSWTWRVLLIIMWPIQWFHSITVTGTEKIGKGPGLLIGMHSTHNVDIILGVVTQSKYTGRVVRGLVHRIVMKFNPYLKWIGWVPGSRAGAQGLIQEGFITACLPGGGREAMQGHENSYSLLWEGRHGFARVAQRTSCNIYISFLENMEEMRFNPIAWVLNLLYIPHLFWKIVDPLPKPIRTKVRLVSMIIWFIFSFVTIPIPAKVTLHVDGPIPYLPTESVETIATRCHDRLQELIDKSQKGRRGRNIPRVLWEAGFWHVFSRLIVLLLPLLVPYLFLPIAFPFLVVPLYLVIITPVLSALQSLVTNHDDHRDDKSS